MLHENIEKLWPLSESYEYAAEVGLALRNVAPGWWQEFERQVIRSRFPLPQAQGFAFLRWLEESPEVTTEELESRTAAVLLSAESPLRMELEASVACRQRSHDSPGDPFPPHELFEQPVALWSPVACAGYPEGASSYLDEWTRTALSGANITMMHAPPATVRELAAVHAHHYIQGLLGLAQAGGGLLTPETLVTPDAELSILAAAGAVMDASRRALKGERDHVPLCLARPGSHHAQRDRGGGTCLINNLAVAAADALNHNARAVAIVDVDAHHGNGTEDIFREDPRVFTFSIHQEGPFFPGTGSSDELGRGQGRGKNLNVPVHPNEDWLGNLERGLVAVARHRPQLILVEFSTDAHRADPASDLQLSDQDYEDAVRMIESIGAPVVYELGASQSERAWTGGVRALVEAAGCR